MRLTPILLASLFALTVAKRAEACGGFFCSNVPIDQAGERIVFVRSENHVQAHVQIQYQGGAREFAWVVPVHARPTVSIGSAALFDFLDQRTKPYFQLDFSNAGSCGQLYPPMYMEDGAVDAGTTAGGGGGVTVVSRESVGPYDVAILTATNAAELASWLETNDYDLTPEGDAALVPYVGSGYYFVALKLQQDKGTGDLRPVVIDFDGDTPCIPIRLTAIASTPNMPITAFILADARAVPINYLHVLINEARIDWWSFGSNYSEVATAAIDEAGGHAFLTEFAGPHAPLTSSAPLYDGRLNTARLAGLTDPVDFVIELQNQNFPRDGLMALLQRYVPRPASLSGIDDRTFYNQISSYRSEIANDPGRLPFDAAAFANELEQSIVAPLRRAQEALSAKPYLTRVFTTMSPSEMTVDPEFAFNTSLPDVSNQHVARLSCQGDATNQVAMVTLSDGRVYELPQGGGTIVTDGPAAARVEQLASMGQPRVITDNTDAIDDTDGGEGFACGCHGLDASIAALTLLPLLRLRRRR